MDKSPISTDNTDFAIYSKSGELELLIENYENSAADYIRVRDTDREKLAELVNKAKGPYRSLRKFAKELNVSPSTIHRIIDTQKNGNCRDELIFEIAEHADKESGVTLKELLHAQGLEKKNNIKTQKYYMRLTKSFIKEHVFAYISALGYSTNITLEPYTNSNFRFDVVISTDAAGKDSGLWALDFFAPSPNDQNTDIVAVINRLDKIMSMLYRDELFVDKISIVVTTPSAFNQIVNRVKNYRISDEISIILLSDKKVKDEFIIPMKMRYTQSIFKDQP